MKETDFPKPTPSPRLLFLIVFLCVLLFLSGFYLSSSYNTMTNNHTQLARFTSSNTPSPTHPVQQPTLTPRPTPAIQKPMASIITVGPGDNGQIIPISKLNVVDVYLNKGWDTPVSSNLAVLVPFGSDNRSPSEAKFHAVTAGKTTITSTFSPDCQSSETCPHYEVTIIVK